MKNKSPIYLLYIFYGMLMFLFLVSPANIFAQSSQQAPTPPESGVTPPLVPKLQVNIPTINFSEVAARGNLLSLPFLADYITGLYKYLLTIVGILAGVMLTLGGVKYLTSGGSPERVTSAKNTIFNALIGLIIAFGSYVILFTINPELVRFKALRIEQVPVEKLVFNELLTTTADTRIPDSADTTSATADIPRLENCPISLNEPATKTTAREPRSREFMQKITSVLTGTTPRERVVQTAQAAAKCGVHFGACIMTARTINEAAGLQSLSQGLGRDIREGGLSTEQARWLIALNCRASLLNPQERAFRSCAGQTIIIPNCPANTKCAAVARAMAIEKFRREIPGWPDSLTNQLEPGDSFWVYYGNNGTLVGQHTAIFMGWEGNKAKVVQGAIRKLVNESAICIKSGCGQMYPITKVFKIQ